MKSYTTLRNAYSSITGRTTSADLTLADQWINDGHRKALKAVPHLREKVATLSTTSGTAYISLPYDFEQILDGVKITISSKDYPIKPAPSRAFWNAVTEGAVSSSDYAEYFWIEPSTKRIYLTPTPATSLSSALSVPYKRRVKDLGIADYTTGTAGVTSGATTVTGSGTTWTSKMAGRYIKLTESDTATSGDGEWYEIASVASTTSLTLVKAYNGTTASGASYTIGQMPLLPEDYHDAPLDWALYRYYKSKNDASRANEHLMAFKDQLKDMGADYSRISSPVLDDGITSQPSNPNLYLTL